MSKPNPASMMEKVTYDFYQLLKRELNSECPQESMSRFLGDIQIFDVEYEDGVIKLEVKKSNGTHFTLTLKPTGWAGPFVPVPKESKGAS